VIHVADWRFGIDASVERGRTPRHACDDENSRRYEDAAGLSQRCQVAGGTARLAIEKE
jgi:hypothetical protein